MSSPHPLRIAILGLGRHGARYANHLLQGDVPGAQLVAVHRRDANAGEAFARQHGIRYVPDPEPLWNDPELDAVVITTPVKYHAPLAIAAAESGKHVLCEKPLARTTAECDAMSAAAKASGVLLTVGQTLRFHPALIAARQEIQRVGRPLALNGGMRQEATTIEWHRSRELAGGGVALEIGVHVVDGLAYLTGCEPKAILGGVARTFTTGEVEDYASLLLEWERGAVGTVEVAKCPGGRSTYFELLGEEGILLADLTENRLNWIQGRQRQELPVPEVVPGIPLLLRAFVAAVRGEAENPIPPEAGRRGVAVAEAFYRGIETGSWGSL